MRISWFECLIVFCAAFIVPGAQAATVVVDAVDSGWYASIDGHTTTNENYFTGFCPDALCASGPGLQEYRSFFVFDFSSVPGTITSATLMLEQEVDGYDSPDATETFEVFSYVSSIPDLVTGAASFGDLGSGTSYGEVTVSPADNGMLISIVLNPSAVADIDGASGLFAITGILNSLSGQTTASEGLWGATFEDSVRTLTVSTIPVPGAVWLFGSGLGLLAWMRRRWQPLSRY